MHHKILRDKWVNLVSVEKTKKFGKPLFDPTILKLPIYLFNYWDIVVPDFYEETKLKDLIHTNHFLYLGIQKITLLADEVLIKMLSNYDCFSFSLCSNLY